MKKKTIYEKRNKKNRKRKEAKKKKELTMVMSNCPMLLTH